MSAEYQFGPLERRGVFLGARLGQIVVVLVSTALAVAILSASPSPIGAALAVTVVSGGGAAILLPVRGRTVEEWTPVLLGFAWVRLCGRQRWVSMVSLRGHQLGLVAGWTNREVAAPAPHRGSSTPFRVVRASDRGLPPEGTQRPSDRLVRDVRRADDGDDAAPYLRGVQLLAARWNSGEVGVLADARARTYTAVIAVGAHSPALSDSDEKQRRFGQWGAVLASLARDAGAVTRLQWLERTVPNDTEVAVGHLRDHRVLQMSNPFVRSYLSLLDKQGGQTQQHEVLLALQVSAARASSTIRTCRAGVDVGACEALSHALLAFADGLRTADIEVGGVLSPRLLAARLRCAADPAARAQLAHRAVADRAMSGASPADALPRRSLTSWSSLQTEGAHHATYWVAEWPRTPVGTDWMSPLLLGGRCRRTVSVVMAPAPPVQALRHVEAARVDDETTASLRQRFGFRRTVRRQREADNVVRAEEELNEGHQHIALSAYITMTAASAVELAAACQEVELQSGLARLDIHREYGVQDVAFSYTLPLCRGLR
jgi:hypothetical protein